MARHETQAAATHSGLTVQPPPLRGMAAALDRNIDALRRRRVEEARHASWQDRVADVITGFTGSMAFVFLHLALFGGWIVVNLGWVPVIEPWDPTFVVLAMIASVEAIFLSTFVLISQNRMAAENDRRADLDLQINLLAEHEVTRLIALVEAVADRLEVSIDGEEELEELKRDVAPETVLNAIERGRE